MKPPLWDVVSVNPLAALVTLVHGGLLVEAVGLKAIPLNVILSPVLLHVLDVLL